MKKSSSCVCAFGQHLRYRGVYAVWLARIREVLEVLHQAQNSDITGQVVVVYHDSIREALELEIALGKQDTRSS